jgi:LPXTG-motif cell wall-anchored protein
LRTVTSSFRSCLIAVAVSAVLVSSSASAANADTGSWSTPATLSAAGSDASGPQLVTDGSTITVIWSRYDGSNNRIQTATSTDAGTTWSTPLDISTAGGNAFNPQLVTDGSTITATWYRSDGSNNRIQTATSTDTGTTWSTPATLSAAGSDASGPQLVTDGRTITVIWYRSDGSNNRIQTATSTDTGTTWSTPLDLSTAGGNAFNPQLVTDGSTITAIWYRSDGSNNRIQAATSTDTGTTWSTPATLSAAGGNASGPQLVTDGSTITATWYRHDSRKRIQVATSTDAGTTWSTPLDLSTAGGNAFNPQLVTDGSTITVIWYRSDGSNNRIQTAISTDTGTTWSTPLDLSTAGGNASGPQLVTDGSTITVIWSRYDGSNNRIQTATSTDAGTTWSTPLDLSTAGGNAFNPQLVTDGSTITATWYRSDGSNNRIQTSSFTADAVQPPDAVQPADELPATGPADTLAPSLLAGGLLVSGAIALLMSRRRKVGRTDQ